jgi:DNA-binding transcriptional LysR family regulator
MKVFVTALDLGSLASAGRMLGRSPAAVSRAIAFLEESMGAELLHRTTRSIKTSQAGERFAEVCRRILTALEEAECVAAVEGAAPRGTLVLTAPLSSGESLLRPILDAYLDAFPAVTARLFLHDRFANLIDEGIDVALRIGHLADSASVAVRVGEVRRLVLAAPDYLARHKPIETPSDLARHQIIAYAPFGVTCWNFAPSPGSSVPRSVHFAPRLVIDTVRGAMEAAADGRGVTSAFSCQAAEYLRRGRLNIVLAGYEHPPVPVHLVTPSRRLAVPKVRFFVDFAARRLRAHFAHLAISAVCLEPCCDAAD